MTYSLDQDISPDDLEDDVSDTLTTMTGRQALITAALAQSDLADMTEALTRSSSQIIVVTVPSAQWAQPLAWHFQRQLSSVSAHAVLELKKDGNHGLAAELTSRLSNGTHLVLVTHDPHTLFPPALQCAVDASFTLAAPNLKVLRQAITNLTGLPVSGLRSKDLAGLDFESLVTALRPGSTPQACINRLRRASKMLTRPKETAVGPKLADLPLSPEIASWSTNLLSELRRVENGQLQAADLPYPLLEGPPGTGKTLIASALARSAGWRLVETSVSSWFSRSDGHLGGVNKAITEFFNEVQRKPRSIGFIDEVDAIPNRATLNERDREWWTTIITAILLQIDGLRRSGKPVMLIGATNFYTRLDAALVRPQRLEHRVSVLPPRSVEEVETIFAHYLQGALDPSVITTAARLCVGKPPAEIEQMVRAARSRAATASRSMMPADLLESVVPPDLRTEIELRATATHEAGHAIVSLALGLPVETVSIVSDGQTGGFTKGMVGSRFPNRAELEAMVTVMLGGRAADIAFGKGAHAGAEQDLAMATKMLSEAIGELGLYDRLAHSASLSPLRRMEEQLEPLLQALLKRALQIVQHDQRAVLALVDELLAERVLDRPAIDRIFETNRHNAETSTGGEASAKDADGPVS